MTPTTFNIKTIELREDAKDIRFDYLTNGKSERIDTYIYYISESHPHKYCMYIVIGEYEKAPNTEIINGKIQLIEMF